mmetsp:Transcript_37751/g.92800  ORF Transcript_37751/g.92800 Transcript_37751/m.92800 type:complete len:204 (+) Transcript_37751:77-688(+)
MRGPALLAVLLAGQLGAAQGIKCYVGESVDRIAPFEIAVDCNNTETDTYDRCYSICQAMTFQNMSGEGGFDYNICRYGCGSLSLCNIMDQRKIGMFVVPVCDCYWDVDEVYWTNFMKFEPNPENRAVLRPVPQSDPPPIPFCCPKCRQGIPGHPESCPAAYTFVQKCCETDGCNFNAACAAAPWSILSLCLLALSTQWLQGRL